MPRIRRLVFCLLAVIALSSCNAAQPPPPPSFSSSSTAGPSVSPAPSPSEIPTAARSCQQRVFASMTEDQRVGQLFMVGLRDDRLGSAEVAGIRRFHFGSVTFIRGFARRGSLPW